MCNCVRRCGSDNSKFRTPYPCHGRGENEVLALDYLELSVCFYFHLHFLDMKKS